MNADILRNAGIDYEFGVRRFLGRAQLFEKLLMKFSRDDTFSRISAAYESGDREQLFACVHEFRGMCGNIGLTSLYEISRELVELLRGGAAAEAELGRVYARLKKEYDAVYAAVVAAMEAQG